MRRLPAGCNRTDGCRRWQTPLVFILWASCLHHLIYDWSLPPARLLLCITPITPQVIWMAIKITTRKKRICLDRWYMAYNRTITITCIIFQSKWYHWDAAAEELTTNHNVYNEGCPVWYEVHDHAWKKKHSWWWATKDYMEQKLTAVRGIICNEKSNRQVSLTPTRT